MAQSPPQANGLGFGLGFETVDRFGGSNAYKEKAPVISHWGLVMNPRQRPTLPPTYAGSTIGGSRLNFRVRNGNGCDPAPMATGKLGVWGPS